MNQELELVAHRLSQAQTPEDVFGEIKARDEDMLPILKQNYRAIAKIVHPDMYRSKSEQALAQATFNLLTDWFNQAKDKVESGQYGGRSTLANITLRSRKREYLVETAFRQERIFNLYPCRFTEAGKVQQAVLKMVRDPRDNDLVENEARALQALARGKDADKFSPYIPALIDTFVYDDGNVDRKAVVIQSQEGWYSLQEVQRAYPNGIDARDMAWMWRRLLVVLGFSHGSGILHGAVLPLNIWILPEEHGLMLTNWSSALFDPETAGETLKVVVPEYTDWYPPEVLKKENPLFGTDIQMSAKCMMWLLGGDPQETSVPNSVPAPIKAFLKGCILPGRRAPQKAWALLEEFDELIGKLWGERKFHPFSMKKYP